MTYLSIKTNFPPVQCFDVSSLHDHLRNVFLKLVKESWRSVWMESSICLFKHNVLLHSIMSKSCSSYSQLINLLKNITTTSAVYATLPMLLHHVMLTSCYIYLILGPGWILKCSYWMGCTTYFLLPAPGGSVALSPPRLTGHLCNSLLHFMNPPFWSEENHLSLTPLFGSQTHSGTPVVHIPVAPSPVSLTIGNHDAGLDPLTTAASHTVILWSTCWS